MTRFFTLIVPLAVLVLAACGGGDSDTSYDTTPGTSVVIGNVVSFDAASAKIRAAVEGVSVSLFGTENSATTDSNGEFEMTDVAPGSYKVVFEYGGGMAQYALSVEADTLVEMRDIVIGGDSAVAVSEVTAGPLPEPTEAVEMITVYWCDEDTVKSTEIAKSTYDADPSSYSTEAPTCETSSSTSTIPFIVIEPFPIIILPFLTLDNGDSYHFKTGTRGTYTGGDFYFYGTKFWANNAGQRGVRSLGDTGSTPLGDIVPPVTGYSKFGVPIVSGHTYSILAKEVGEFIIVKVTGFTASSSVSLRYVRK